MRNILTLMAGAILIVSVTGCATSKTPEAIAQAHKSFMTQQRTYESFRIKGPVTIDVKEGGELVSEAPLHPLHSIPQQADTLGRVLDTTKAVAGIAGAVIAADAALDAASKPPIVVDPPEPIFIEPFILE